MSGPFSPSETRYEDNKATWLPEVGFSSAANGREKTRAARSTSAFQYLVMKDEGDRYVAIEDLLLSSFPEGRASRSAVASLVREQRRARPKPESSSRSSPHRDCSS